MVVDPAALVFVSSSGKVALSDWRLHSNTDRGIPAVGVMQILCIGMALRMVAGSSYALLKSQGRFRAILWNRWGFVALQVIGLLMVLWLGGGINSVATVVGAVSTIMGPVTFYTA